MLPECMGYGTEWTVKGFLDDTNDPLGNFPAYAPVIGPIHGYIPEPDDIFICALGSVKGKKHCIEHLLSQGARFETIIHKSVIIGKNAVIGKGCLFCRNVTIGCDTHIDNYVSLQAGCMIGHDSRIGAWVHCHPRVFMGGKSRFGEGVYAGYNAFLQPGREAGDFSILAAGACIFRDVPAGTTAIGNPANIRHPHKQHIETMIDESGFSTLLESLFTHSVPQPDEDFRMHDEWGSLMILDLMAEVEDRFGVTLDITEIDECHTFRDVLQLIESKQR